MEYAIVKFVAPVPERIFVFAIVTASAPRTYVRLGDNTESSCSEIPPITQLAVVQATLVLPSQSTPL